MVIIDFSAFELANYPSDFYRDPDAIVQEGIARLRTFFKRMGLPGTLAELGIGEDRLEEMAKKACSLCRA